MKIIVVLNTILAVLLLPVCYVLPTRNYCCDATYDPDSVLVIFILSVIVTNMFFFNLILLLKNKVDFTKIKKILLLVVNIPAFLAIFIRSIQLLLILQV